MEIKIAEQTVKLSIPFLKQDFVRDTENEIKSLFLSLRRKFPRKDESELLAMIIYQYASYYRELLLRHEEAKNLAMEIENTIDSIEV
ncbi:MAG: cell division protein ZapA [Muribaculaceae bacterium]|nr:cell division protein ZapA [Muribaculaceae bacterium]